jgi:tryptophan synthase alpha chain
MARIAEATAGFVYLVSVTGVTGVQDKLQDRVERLVAQLKAVTNKPVAVGFGVSKPEQAAQLAAWGADGVIVGSALVRALGEAPTPGALPPSTSTSTLALRS